MIIFLLPVLLVILLVVLLKGNSINDGINDQVQIKIIPGALLPEPECMKKSSNAIKGNSCQILQLSLANTQNSKLSDFSIIIPSPRRVLGVDSKDFTIEHITGDLHYLKPSKDFGGISPNQNVTLDLIMEYWIDSQTDIFPRWMLETNGRWSTIQNTNTEDLSSFIGPILNPQAKQHIIMNTTSRYDQYTTKVNEQLGLNRIIPTPKKAEWKELQSISIQSGFAIENVNVPTKQENVMKRLLEKFQFNGGENQVKVQIQINDALAAASNCKFEGGYEMKLDAGKIEIIGYDSAGALNGFHSLMSLVDVKNRNKLPSGTVQDCPRYSYRGVMVDVGRNFHSKDSILRLVDQMTYLKLNKLHLHLSDDEGWRLEIPGLPELTKIGSQRDGNGDKETKGLLPMLGHGAQPNQPSDGYLTESQFIEILEYSKDRMIEVIPEFDMPAHSRAAVISLQNNNEYKLHDPLDTSEMTTVQYYNRQSVLNVCLPSTKKFVLKIVEQVQKMYQKANVTLQSWHFGGDEMKNIKYNVNDTNQHHPLEKSPVCQELLKTNQPGLDNVEQLGSWFASQVNGWLKPFNISRFQSWQDGIKTFASGSTTPVKTRVNVWDTLFWGGSDMVDQLSGKEFDIVLSMPDYLYLDMPNEIDPYERGYYWASRGNTIKKMFQFVPGNLPSNAELSKDNNGAPMTLKSNNTKPNIEGISGHLWSEVVRTDEQMEYMIHPRLFALAERAWYQSKWEPEFKPITEYSATTNFIDKVQVEEDYTGFINAIGYKELGKLDRLGVQYRLPMVGSRVENGMVLLRSEIPGVKIQYSSDQTQWKQYDGSSIPLSSGSTLYVRTISTDSKRTGRISSVIG